MVREEVIELRGNVRVKARFPREPLKIVQSVWPEIDLCWKIWLYLIFTPRTMKFCHRLGYAGRC